MIAAANIKTILTDIEGTTSSLSFVKDVLFPYALVRIPDYVTAHENEISEILNEVRKIENKQFSLNEIVAVLLEWMDEDKKITPLKILQGLIWREGYEKGELQGHIYEDATRGLKRWRQAGLELYVYSSGSIAAQKLLFAHTEEGDLTPLFSGYFDTTSGPKLEAASYKKIAQEIGVTPAAILFLSDSVGEIEAANAAGFQTIILDRARTLQPQKSKIAYNFDDIKLQEMAA